MVIITVVSYPPEQTKEVNKVFRELPPVPAYVKMKGPQFSGEVGEGIKALIVYEYDQTKIKEALEYVGTRLAKYFGVPGFTYSSHVWLEIQEGLKMVGMT